MFIRKFGLNSNTQNKHALGINPISIDTPATNDIYSKLLDR